MEGTRQWPANMQELSDKLIAVTERLGVPESKRERLAQEMIEALAALFGGTTLYVPKLDEAKREARNAVIFSEFTGRNFDALCHRYDLSTRQLRRIIAQQGDKRFAARQSTLAFD